MPTCHFCGKPVGEAEHCYGCGEYICPQCDETQPMGDHDVEEHQAEEEAGREEE